MARPGAGGSGDKKAKTEEPKPVDLSEQQKRLVAGVPYAIDMLFEVMSHPTRHAQAQLAAAKTWLNRAGIPEVSTMSIEGSQEVKHTGRFIIELVEVPKPKDDSGAKR